MLLWVMDGAQPPGEITSNGNVMISCWNAPVLGGQRGQTPEPEPSFHIVHLNGYSDREYLPQTLHRSSGIVQNTGDWLSVYHVRDG